MFNSSSTASAKLKKTFSTSGLLTRCEVCLSVIGQCAASKILCILDIWFDLSKQTCASEFIVNPMPSLLGIALTVAKS